MSLPSTSTLLPWEEKAATKRLAAAALIPQDWRLSAEQLETLPANVLDIPRACGLLSPDDISITESYDACELLEHLATGTFTSVQVTTAFCKRAAIAQQLTACLTETFFPQALERAAALDAHLASSGSPVGPLHGLPISIKDSFSVIGIPTTLGFVSFLDREPLAHNSALVQILLDAGAILYVKTNVPQTLMTADSHNNVFGRTLNPHNRELGAGGSSGGEGALVALRGSPLGIGTDIAGSIRIPSVCCGTVGFKPSVGRVPYGGQTSCHRPGSPGIIASAGPLANSVRDAELLLKIIIGSNVADLDGTALGIPWNEPPLAKSSLTIGLMLEDVDFPLQPPMLRTMTEAVDKLKAAGHQVINITPLAPQVADMSKTSWRYFVLDPSQTAIGHIRVSGEPVVPSLKALFRPAGEPGPTVGEIFDLNAAKGVYKSQMHKLWIQHKLDAIICPGYSSTAQPHDLYGHGTYTVPWNLLDYPAVVLPFGKANKAADAEYIRPVTYSPPYNPEAIEGAPCHVQLVGRPLRDEQLLQAALIVENALKV